MINVCQHPLMSRVNIHLNGRTVEQCSACSIAVRLVEMPIEIPEVGGWLPFAKTVLPNGHVFYQKILGEPQYAGEPHEAKTPPTPTSIANENYFEREFENLRTQAREILTRLNRVSREFYSVRYHSEIERKQANCQHEATYKFNMGNYLIRRCLHCRKRLA